MTQKKTSSIETITFIAAVLLMMLFGYAALSKLVDHVRFVAQMELAPSPIMQVLAPTLGWLIPMIMIAIVVLLCFDRWRKKGLIASFSLLLVFEIYVAGMLMSGKELPCTCGGLHSTLQWQAHLWFNAIFMIIALLPLLYTSSFIHFIHQNIRHSKLWE